MSKSTLGAVAGAVIGFYIGGPAGAKIGWTIGSFLFAESGPDTQGPRLDSLAVESLDYGSPIPIGYGRFRIAGFRFWQRDIREQANTETQGKGGGGGATNTTFTYYGTWAIALTGNELAGVRKIWLDSVLFYDAGDSASTETIIASNKEAEYFTFYPGSATDEVDSLIQATEGAANTPAYRHVSKIVFDDVPLEKYGRRIPNVTVECVESGSISAYPWVQRDAGFAAYTVRAVLHDPDNAIYIAIGDSNKLATSRDGVTWKQVSLPSDPYTPSPSASGIVNGGDTYVAIWSNGIVFTSYDGESWAQGWYYSPSPWVKTASAVAYGNGLFIIGGSNVFASSFDGALWNHRDLPISGVVHAAFGGGVFLIASGTAIATSGDGFSWAEYVSPFGATPITKIYYANSLFIAGSNTGYISTSPDGAGWSTPVDTGVGGAIRGITYGGGIWTVIESGRGVGVSDDLVTWTITSNVTGVSSITDAVHGYGMLVSSGSAGGVFTKYDGSIILPTITTLSAIQTDICERAGLTASDIDVTELTDEVDGYIITSNMSARAASEPLMRAYFYDGAEYGNKINFVKRGGSSIKTITQDELGAAPYGSDKYALKQTRMQNSELPSDVSIGYISAVRDYEIATQRAQRINYSVPNSIGQELAIVMSDDKALQIAEIGLYNSYVEREKFNFSLTNDHIDLDPTNIITVTHDGDSRIVRLVKLSYGDVIECDAISEDSQVYTSSATAATDPYVTPEISVPGPTLVQYLDIPAMRNVDGGAGISSESMYFAVSGYKTNWPGAQIFKSLDEGATYTAIESAFTAATMGSATTALPDAVSTLWDRDSTLTVSLANGSFSSTTEANALRESNNLLVGNEIIQFVNATLNADGTFTLDTFLRGRRGTEWATGTHAIGDRVVLLTTTSIRKIDAMLNQERTYKAVTIGTYLDDASKKTATNTGVNLKPFSPAYVRGSRDGSNNLTVTWMRRSRYIGSPLGTRPLYEDSESYEVDVMSGATVLRTISASSETASYTAAQQTSDFGAPQSSIDVIIFQISGTIGRGCGQSATV